MNKAHKIIDVCIDGKWNERSIASALYISAKGTRHFYEALELLAVVYPMDYMDEFEALKKEEQ